MNSFGGKRRGLFDTAQHSTLRQPARKKGLQLWTLKSNTQIPSATSETAALLAGTRSIPGWSQPLSLHIPSPHSALGMPHWEAQWRTAPLLPSEPAAEGSARDSPPNAKPNRDVLQHSLHTAKDIFGPRSSRDMSQRQGIATTEVCQQCQRSCFKGQKETVTF